MGKKLQGKIAFVTGGARGIGAATCWRFADEGVDGIVIADKLEDELHETREKIEQRYNIKVVPIKMDVSHEMDWIDALYIIREQFGKLDILVNNAGISHRARFVDCTVEAWNKVIAINQTGTFLGMKHSVPLMKKSKKSSLINISSIAGLTGYYSSPYTASKWAVRGMTKAAAMEFGDWGIRVNSIHPGFIWTPLTKQDREMVEKFNKINALNREGEPDEVTKPIVFLASDDSSYITGSELVIDGGHSAGGGVRMIGKDLGIYKND
ncbi:SDR family oxidoreductase [Salicibibacter cibarius]|uniref:SDR family oxidoreductase n=1 Tax=Salicibibacter cibarius TaxID=2743000 RepID=A0A7T6Z7G1_9BACI|nr:SDR family oxidoreductase [Salicibibacter cibarius]QQK77771.1 SDR family oxidoreductase [Salicibibacter cibarius]